MRYILPQNVLSPKDAISNIEILFDGGEDSVSIARLSWFGDAVIAMRWNVALREWDDPDKASEITECLGMPVSRGYPTWFVLPNDMFDNNSDLHAILRSIPSNT